MIFLIFVTKKNMKFPFLFSLVSVLMLLGCSSTPTAPQKSSSNDSISLQDTSVDGIRIAELRKMYEQRGPVKFPVTAICVGDNDKQFEQTLWKDTLITRETFSCSIVGILPDTSENFCVITLAALDVLWPYFITIDKHGKIINSSSLFSWDSYDYSMNMDSVLYLSEYTVLNKDLTFVQTLEAIDISHVWAQEGGVMMNDVENALKDSACIHDFKSETKGFVNKKGDAVADWEESVFDKTKVVRDTTIFFHYEWELYPELDLDKMLGRKTPKRHQ